jgi:hypothetical protein
MTRRVKLKDYEFSSILSLFAHVRDQSARGEKAASRRGWVVELFTCMPKIDQTRKPLKNCFASLYLTSSSAIPVCHSVHFEA